MAKLKIDDYSFAEVDDELYHYIKSFKTQGEVSDFSSGFTTERLSETEMLKEFSISFNVVFKRLFIERKRDE